MADDADDEGDDEHNPHLFGVSERIQKRQLVCRARQLLLVRLTYLIGRNERAAGDGCHDSKKHRVVLHEVQVDVGVESTALPNIFLVNVV